MPYLEKTITAGNIKETRRYFAPRFGKNATRGSNENTTPDQVEKINERIAKDKLEKLVHTNFIGGVDYFTTLTFNSKVFDQRRNWEKNPATSDEIAWIKAECSKFMRKMRESYKKLGLALKYIKITEIRDEDGIGIRPHLHLFLNKSSMDMLAEIWPHGRVTTSTLDDDYQRLSELISYFTKQKLEPKEKEILAKRWDQSKNLTKPEVDVVQIKAIDVTRPPREVDGVNKGLKKYAGYNIIEWRNGYSDRTGPWQYVKMIKVAEVGSKGKQQKRKSKQRKC